MTKEQEQRLREIASGLGVSCEAILCSFRNCADGNEGARRTCVDAVNLLRDELYRAWKARAMAGACSTPRAMRLLSAEKQMLEKSLIALLAFIDCK